MSTVSNGEYLDRSACPALYRFDLLPSTVLVLVALDQEHGHADGGQNDFDVPRAEVGMQPDIVPSPECNIRIRAMMPREASA